jgi:hypothetical protein
MGHARHEDLLDLEDVLREIRKLPGISERSHGVFYLKRLPFLHFHTKDGNRWADVKVGTSWGPEIPLPFQCGSRAKRRFLKAVTERHQVAASGSRDKVALSRE